MIFVTKNLEVVKIKALLCEILDNIRNEIINVGNTIFQNPELGFKEFNTSKIACDYLKGIGIDIEESLSITGFKASLGTGKKINIGLIAELDAIPTYGHKYSSNDMHAAHACGHSNQLAIMLGVMKALKNSGLLDKIDAKVTLIGTPAEEFINLNYRKNLIKENKIRYMSGKQDMIANGIFDDIDLVISCHTMGGIPTPMADVNSSLNGFILKNITYYGKASHAGAAPHLGINALNAAVIGLSAVNAQRETFLDEDNIRVHGIIKEGGQSTNSVPEKVVIEAYVRGARWESILDANSKVDRAFKAGAYAVGGKCVIENTIGYLPFAQCTSLSNVLKNNMTTLIGPDNVIDGKKSMASGDIGDLAAIKPTIQFGFSGFKGNVHGADFEIADEELAYIIPAKAIAMTVYDLLADGGILADKIIKENPPKLTKEEYIKNWLHNKEL
ncbi:amidohydrolase [Clostridium oryzae]|uniref:Peptidase M20 domain-containing protein 2 n=1 Tax=Clostridium oryzae TaxID=1450648 RepID=A0A1V4IK11_9CLOT|nr:amidohydrolase [Clostridium oryzae]OPJ60209.1 N-acetyldiaminopimelate deacetylase [Clostridium oryzae]